MELAYEDHVAFVADHDDADDGAQRDVPSTLTAILDPAEALAAAQRMQRWYRSTPQGTKHSHFGRDGRKIEARQMLEVLETADIDD
jgi:hypothetical protein